MRRTLLTVDGFYGEAKKLRRHFDERFADPRSADAGRFVWDYWHVPGQYTALRTPAYHFFPPAMYRKFHEHLVLWGRRNLGCHDVSPPWLSCYIDGCRQELHSDLPHGPWAFVYSLTPWTSRKFRGGETLLLKEEMLRFWERLDTFRGLEEPDVLQEVPARFDRLVVFDPRIPHGVRRVEGVQDPRLGRLVVHGWFVQPRPFIEGSLSRSALQGAIESLGQKINSWLSQGTQLRGMASFRFRVSASGKVTECRLLSSTLVAFDSPPALVPAFHREITQTIREFRFARQRGISDVTLPLTFAVD